MKTLRVLHWLPFPWHLLEKLTPKHKDLDYKSHLKLDVAAFLVIVLSLNGTRPLVGILYETIHLKGLGVIAATLSWPYLLKSLWHI
jgi:hypothetical protein